MMIKELGSCFQIGYDRSTSAKLVKSNNTNFSIEEHFKNPVRLIATTFKIRVTYFVKTFQIYDENFPQMSDLGIRKLRLADF